MLNQETIILDQQTFKALAVDTRLQIIRLLQQKQYTLTELAEQLKLKPSSIKEHLDVLVNAGLIKQLDEGRKWKYYTITSKIKNLSQPRPQIKVYIAFIVSLFAFLGSIALLFANMPYLSNFQTTSNTADIAQIAQPIAKNAMVESASLMMQQPQQIYNSTYFLFALILVIITSIIIGYSFAYIKKKKVK